MKLIVNRNKELEIILDSIKDAVCIVDAKGIARYWNKGAEKLYGIRKEEILNRPITEFFPSSLLHRILKENKAYEDIYNSPKENCYNITSASPLYFNGKLVGGISIDRDITDHIKTTELLNKTKSNLEALQEELSAINKTRSPFSDILGNNMKFRDVIKLAKDIAHSDINILIKGESGTGKELFARAIHMASGREGYFVPINCSAIPNELIESELFGYAQGAFTGALKEGRTGKIELANRGTLFLDEIGDMPLNMQPKILRVLEDGEITPVGSEKSIKVDIRVIAASNKDLEKMVELGTFRKDLFYRLNSVIIDIPPLRDRKDDIPFLANRFVQDFCMEYGVNILNFSHEVMDALVEHDWEGNVRELKNLIERMVILARNSDKKVIDVDLLPDNILKNSLHKHRERKNLYDLNAVVWEAEKKTILKALEKAGYNKLKAAKLLNIPRSTLYFKMDKYNIREVPKD